MWMSVAHSRPDHGRTRSAKDPNPSDRQEERRDLHLFKRLAQPLLVPGLAVTEEAQCEVHLLRWKPLDPFRPGVKPRQRLLATRRQLQPDKETLGHASQFNHVSCRSKN